MARRAAADRRESMPYIDVTSQHNVSSVVDMLQSVENSMFVKYSRPIGRRSLLQEANNELSLDLKKAN